MNLCTYEFSKEAEPELLEFLNVVKERCFTEKNLQKQKLLEKIFPPDDYIFKKLNEIGCTKNDENVVDLTEEDEDNNVESNNKNDQLEFHRPEKSYKELSILESNVTLVEDLVDTVKERLDTQTLTQNDIIRLTTECTGKQLDNVFKSLSEALSSESVYNLGRVIATVTCAEQNVIVLCFCRHILLQKLLTETSTFVEKSFVEFFDKFQDIFTSELIKILSSADDIQLKTLQNSINVLGDEHKQHFLKNFLENCPTLKLQYVTIIETLINSKIKYELLKKVVEVMANNSEAFASEKKFGKLLAVVVQASGNNIVHVEEQLRYITSQHKSVWKIQARKALEACTENSLHLSQSFSHRT